MSQPDDDSSLVTRILQGDVDALAELREKHHGTLLKILSSPRGMNRTEAEDRLADLWGDCVPGNVDRPSILEKLRGKGKFSGSLQNWLLFMTRRNDRLKNAIGREEGYISYKGCMVT